MGAKGFRGRLVGAVLAAGMVSAVGGAPATGSASAGGLPTGSLPHAVPQAVPQTAPEAVPQAVPPAVGTNAVITVKVGGSRTGTSGVTDLAGVVLQLETGGEAGPTGPVNQPWATCTSDADGDCSFVVPDAGIGGGNRDQRFWITQTSAPSGWYSNPSLGVGSPVASRAYAFRTGATLAGGNTYSSQQQFMIGTGNDNTSASGGIWHSSRTNPAFPAQCGINVGIVHDLSNSLSAADLTALKGASSAFVTALQGTPSAVGTFTFATAAPAAGANNTTLPLTSVATEAGGNSVRAKINGFNLPGGNAGGTNWDRGLAQVAESTGDFDVAVIITDGNPTYYGSPNQGPGSLTRFREVENGVFSANAIKAESTRVIAFGVGSGVGNAGSGQNLRAISGTQLDSDYFQTTSYAQAAAQLRELALGSCQGSISVVKAVVPPTAPPGSVAGAQPAAGWDFTAETTAPGVTVTPPTTRTTDETGATNFPLVFADGATSGAVSLTETQQDGYTLEQVDGSNATCVRTDTGAAVAATNAGAAGFTVSANATYPISCTVYNRAPDPQAVVRLSKTWVIDGITYADGEQPDGFVAHAHLDGEDVGWETEETGFSQGETVTVDETVDLSTRPGCTVTSQELTSRNGVPVSVPLPSTETLTQPVNAFGITNEVTCSTRLSLVKQVDGGDADPSIWTLTSIAPSGAVPGPAGAGGTPETTEVTVTPNVRYGLTESGGDPRYLQYVDPNAEIPEGNSGSWTCQQIGPDGEVLPGFSDGLNGGVTVPIGYDVRCTTVNQTAEIILIKEVVNAHGGTAVPSDFTLSALPSPTPPVDGLTPVSAPGSTAGTTFAIRPDHDYLLRETAVPGYDLRLVTCVIAREGRTGTTVRIAPGDAVACTFVNEDRPARLTLRKEVDNGTTGGTAGPADWTLTATPDGIDGQDPVSGDGADGVTGAEVSAGTYDLSEEGPAGYDAGTWVCEGGALEVDSVTLANGADVTCTITNTARQATLTLVKEVHGGTADDQDWTLTADGPTTISGTEGEDAITNAPVQAGSYELTESDGPDGYTLVGWDCDVEGVLDGATVTITLGQDVRCRATNRETPTKPPPPGDSNAPGVSGPSGPGGPILQGASQSLPWASGSDLPDTGGPAGRLIAVALLLLGGGSWLLAQRRREDEPEA